jgi:hypothetical protein
MSQLSELEERLHSEASKRSTGEPLARAAGQRKLSGAGGESSRGAPAERLPSEPEPMVPIGFGSRRRTWMDTVWGDQATQKRLVCPCVMQANQSTSLMFVPVFVAVSGSSG